MKYDLVFEGGGAKGAVFVGALKAFEDCQHTIGRVVGTSAGAITATLVCAGYSSEKMMVAVREKLPDGKPRFSSFMDVPESFDESEITDSLSLSLLKGIDIPMIPDFIERHLDRMIFDTLMQSSVYRHVFSFVEQGGWYAGNKFLDWIRDKLDEADSGLGSTSLAEFNMRTGKDLSLVASDITDQNMLVLNHRTAPQCPVIWAVRMSMSVPFAWQEVIWRPEWGTYLGKNISGHRIVDGGLLSNFPIAYLVSSDPDVIAAMGTQPESTNVLGFLIDETIEVPGSGDAPKSASNLPPQLSQVDIKEIELVQRIKNLVDTVLSGHDKIVIDAYKDYVVRLPAKGYSTLDFDMTDERMDALIEAGKVTTDAYLASLSG
jgi:predicted acylesterase/phospholipase RssA